MHDREARNDFWSKEGNYIYRHHVEPVVKLHVLKEESFPIFLKDIGLTRSTNTDLDVMQEKRIDDQQNVDANRSLSDSWTGFTNFTPLKEEPPRGYMRSGERLARFQTTTRPDHVCGPKYGPKLGKPLRIEKNKYGKTRSQKLDNARRLKRTYFIDPG